jgi:hypothetical protein
MKIGGGDSMTVCNECGEVVRWLDEYGWCRDCIRACKGWYDNLDDSYKFDDDDF